jgi:hypothetical protein
MSGDLPTICICEYERVCVCECESESWERTWIIVYMKGVRVLKRALLNMLIHIVLYSGVLVMFWVLWYSDLNGIFFSVSPSGKVGVASTTTILPAGKRFDSWWVCLFNLFLHQPNLIGCLESILYDVLCGMCVFVFILCCPGCPPLSTCNFCERWWAPVVARCCFYHHDPVCNRKLCWVFETSIGKWNGRSGAVCVCVSV